MTKSKNSRRSWRLGGSIPVVSVALVIATSACSSPTPATSSSSHWVTCDTLAQCTSVSGAAACTDGYCVDSSGQRLESGGTPNPTPASCDPLAAHELPVTLGTVLGVGRDDATGTLYLADQVPSLIERVFVSNGDSLFRKRIKGSGSSGGGADADYNFSFEDGTGSTPSLLIQRRGGATVAMAIGHDPKTFIGSGSIDESLTVVDESAVASLTLRNLPGTVHIEYVADVDDGNAIVITHPTDDWTQDDYRLFYGPEGQSVERHIDQVMPNRSGGESIQFEVDGSPYTVQFNASIAPGADGGIAVQILPGSLDTGTGAPKVVTERRPTPTTLAGFDFTCL